MPDQKTMTRTHLRTMFDKKIAWDKATGALFIEHFFQEISAALIRQEPVKIEGFGSFSIKVRKSRVARHMGSKEPIITAEQRTVTFAPSPKFITKKHTS